MRRIKQDIREKAKRATQYNAVVVDVHGGRASARLSTNGAIVHNMSVIGGPVEIGDRVLVDYTTPDPTIIATSKSWLTDDDLQRALNKIQTPNSLEAQNEIAEWIVTQLDDPLVTKYIPQKGLYGLYYAMNYCWDQFTAADYWPDLIVRYPPGWAGTPEDEHMDEFYDGGVVASHIGDSREPFILNNTWATQVNGQRYQNLAFRAVSSYYWLTVYNYYGWFNNYPTYNRLSGELDFIAKNCTFNCIGYPEDIYSLVPAEYNNGIPYANFWLIPYGSGDPTYMYFYDCSFYARTNPSATVNPHAFYYDATTGDEDCYVYLFNCIIDCGPQPFSNEDGSTMDEGYGGNYGLLHVYAYNCKFIGGDPAAMENLTILDKGDRSSILHVHTSGSSGGYDPMAIHTNVAGEWI